MKFKFFEKDDCSFILAFDFLHDRKGAFGVFLELFRRRTEIRWREDVDI